MGTVLSTLTTEESHLRRDGRVPRFYRSWRFGEIREAIRQELERRDGGGRDRMKLASLRTSRGLKALEEEGDLTRPNRRYRLSEERGWAEHAHEAIRTSEQAVRDRKACLRVKMEHEGQTHRITLAFEPKLGGPAEVTISWLIYPTGRATTCAIGARNTVPRETLA
ncbi:MAG: hypothetical protein WAN74_05900 [Thermoplasmata archaeon]